MFIIGGENIKEKIMYTIQKRLNLTTVETRIAGHRTQTKTSTGIKTHRK